MALDYSSQLFSMIKPEQPASLGIEFSELLYERLRERHIAREMHDADVSDLEKTVLMIQEHTYGERALRRII